MKRQQGIDFIRTDMDPNSPTFGRSLPPETTRGTTQEPMVVPDSPRMPQVEKFEPVKIDRGEIINSLDTPEFKNVTGTIPRSMQPEWAALYYSDGGKTDIYQLKDVFIKKMKERVEGQNREIQEKNIEQVRSMLESFNEETK